MNDLIWHRVAQSLGQTIFILGAMALSLWILSSLMWWSSKRFYQTSKVMRWIYKGAKDDRHH